MNLLAFFEYVVSLFAQTSHSQKLLQYYIGRLIQGYFRSLGPLGTWSKLLNRYYIINNKRGQGLGPVEPHIKLSTVQKK